MTALKRIAIAKIVRRSHQTRRILYIMRILYTTVLIYKSLFLSFLGS